MAKLEDNGLSDDGLTKFLSKVSIALKEAEEKARNKVKVLIAQKDFPSAALLQASITLSHEKCLKGENDLQDLQNSAEITFRQGDIPQALHLQCIVLEHLIANDAPDNTVSPTVEKILEMVDISRFQISRVARRYELEEEMEACVQLHDHISIAFLLNHERVFNTLKSWQYSFCFEGWRTEKFLQGTGSFDITKGSVLHYAVAFGSPDAVETLLKCGAVSSQQDAHGNEALYVAVMSARLEMVEILLSKCAGIGKSIRIRTPYIELLDRLESAYNEGARESMLEVALKMIDKGADINWTNGNDRSLFYLAVKYNHQSTLLSLLDRGASAYDEEDIYNGWRYYRNHLGYAVIDGKYDIVKILLDHDDKIHQLKGHWKCLEESSDQDAGSDIAMRWFRAARCAAKAGRQDIVKLFLEYGIPVNFRDDRGHSLLLSAIEEADDEHADLVWWLVDKGAKINFKTYRGEFPLKSAVVQNYSNIVDILLSHGADVNLADIGYTPLYYAIQYHIPGSKIVQQLLERGARVNIIDYKGNSALHLAAETGDWEVIQAVLEATQALGCPLDPKNCYDQTPLDVCMDIFSTKFRYRTWAAGRGVVL